MRRLLYGNAIGCFFIALLSQACSEAISEKPKSRDELKLQTKLPQYGESANVVTLRQTSLPTLEEVFTVPNKEVDPVRYVQGETIFPLVDILIVIDNSGSMSEEQKKLAEKMRPLLSELAYVDWQINVISTDSPCSTKDYLPLKPSDSDLPEKFSAAINIGTSGSATERPLLMAKLNITGAPGGKGNCSPKPWLRDDAKLVIFLLTDEDERNSSLEPSIENADSILQMLLDEGFTIGKTARIYGIFSHPSKPCNSASFNDKGAPIIADLIEKAKGLWGDICASDYSNILSDISKDIAQLFQVSIPLGVVPAPGSVYVLLNQGEMPIELWRVVGSYLILKQALVEHDELVIFFKLGFTDALALTKAEKPYQVVVNIDGKEIDERDYLFRERERLVSLKKIPTVGSEIRIQYKDVDRLFDSFPFPIRESSEGIYCYLESGELLNHDYYPGDEVIYFEVPPPELSEVNCLFN